MAQGPPVVAAMASARLVVAAMVAAPQAVEVRARVCWVMEAVVERAQVSLVAAARVSV